MRVAGVGSERVERYLPFEPALDQDVTRWRDRDPIRVRSYTKGSFPEQLPGLVQHGDDSLPIHVAIERQAIVGQLVARHHDVAVGAYGDGTEWSARQDQWLLRTAVWKVPGDEPVVASIGAVDGATSEVHRTSEGS